MKRALTASIVLVVSTPLAAKSDDAAGTRDGGGAAQAEVHAPHVEMSADAPAHHDRDVRSGAGHGPAILTFGNLGKKTGPVFAAIN